MKYTAELKKPERHFLPEDFTLTDWAALEPYFSNLEQRKLDSPEALEKWLTDISEFEAIVNEDACWRQIRMTCDTENKQLEEAFTYFCMEIQPRIQPYADRLNRMLRGWANYFREGAVSAAYRIVDAHACFRLRQWLGRRERVQGSSRSRYSEPYLRRTYGLFKLAGRRRPNIS